MFQIESRPMIYIVLFSGLKAALEIALTPFERPLICTDLTSAQFECRALIHMGLITWPSVLLTTSLAVFPATSSSGQKYFSTFPVVILIFLIFIAEQSLFLKPGF